MMFMEPSRVNTSVLMAANPRGTQPAATVTRRAFGEVEPGCAEDIGNECPPFCPASI